MKLQGKGSIEQLEKDRPAKRCRKWRLWQRADGKNRSRRFDGTYRDAQAALADFRRDLSGMIPDAGEFGEYARRWLAYREMGGELAPGTLRNDRRDVKTLSLFLGGTSLQDITPETVRDIFVTLRTKGGVAGKPLSGTTCNHVFTTLSAVLSQAVDDGKITANPCDKVSAPRQDTKERHTLDAEGIDCVFSAMRERQLDGFGVAIMVMLDTGMRSEEVLALAPRDIDYLERCIHVRRALKEATNEIGETKSAAAVRIIPMTERLMDVCREWDSMRDIYGVRDSDTFVCNLDGSRWTINTFRKWWRGIRADVGADGITPHEIRHSWLTKMGAFCNEFTLQKLAGWSSSAPARVYVHQNTDALYSAIARSQISPGVTAVTISSPASKKASAN